MSATMRESFSAPLTPACYHAEFDIRGFCGRSTTVRLLNQIVAIVLLALWVPATLHCAFGSVSEWDNDLCAAACNHDTDGNHQDACTVVESGDYMSAANLAHVPMPNLSVIACIACLHARLLDEARPIAPPAWTKDDPAAWVPVWAFVARAALPARAPTLS